jgi:TRAP-type mannitol/chloroaromatic compound transport system substrate-binding protein
MKKVTILSMIFGFVLAFALTVPGHNVQAADKYKLQISAGLPSASPSVKILERMAKRINAMSAGRLEVEILPDGAVVKVFQVLDAVHKGVINGGQAWTHYWSGKHPAGLLFSAPVAGLGWGLDQRSVLAWMYFGDGNELYQQYLTEILGYNIKGFMALPMGPEAFGWFKKPFKSVKDLAKVKFRSPPGIPAESFKAIGMPVVSMPGGETVAAGQRGVIDGGEIIGPAEDMALGMHTVWKNYYLQGLHQCISIGDIYVNLDWWNKLPADLQAIFENATLSAIADGSMYYLTANSKALKELVEKHNVKLHDTPADYTKAYMEASKEILDKYAAKDPFFKKVLTSMQEWAELTVPYQEKVNGLYYNMGHIAIEEGVISSGK